MSALTLLHLWYRTYQLAFGLGARLLPWRRPEAVTGAGSFRRLPDLLQKYGARRPLAVASRRQCADPAFRQVLDRLEGYALYTGVTPNPPVAEAEAIAALYRAEHCDGFVAVGGGSPMDAAKAAAALLARPHRTLAQMAGLLKVRRPIPPFIAVPTTAGTGSETTIAAVVTGADHRKYAVSDLCLIPRCAVLDPLLTVSLPPHTTAETGMDALTHAVEAYLGRFYPTRETNRLAEQAVVTIFQTLEHACAHGDDVAARQALLTASYQAGFAFTRAGVGNVHAIAHTLGGLYGVAHGLANAVLLPVVLRDYGPAAHRKLARLAELVGLTGDSEADRANAFIDAISAMERRLGIPTGFTCIREQDLLRMAAWAAADGGVSVTFQRGAAGEYPFDSAEHLREAFAGEGAERLEDVTISGHSAERWRFALVLADESECAAEAVLLPGEEWSYAAVFGLTGGQTPENEATLERLLDSLELS